MFIGQIHLIGDIFQSFIYNIAYLIYLFFPKTPDLKTVIFSFGWDSECLMTRLYS